MMYFAYGVYAVNNVFGVDYNAFYGVVTGLTLYNGSVIAELVRSGVHRLPRGQSEAGLSIGLSRGQVLRSIQLPQALTAMLPGPRRPARRHPQGQRARHRDHLPRAAPAGT